MENLAKQIIFKKVTDYLLLQLNVIQAISGHAFNLIVYKFNSSDPSLQVLTH